MTDHAVSRVVVVGAGHAGDTFAALLRQAGFVGELIVFGDEPEPPYHRPPLSKEFLDGPLEKWLREPTFYAEQGVTLRLGEAVVEIDRAAATVTSSAGRVWSYDYLVLATGAASRALLVSGADLDGVGMLRSLADARALRRRVLGRGGRRRLHRAGGSRRGAGERHARGRGRAGGAATGQGGQP